MRLPFSIFALLLLCLFLSCRPSSSSSPIELTVWTTYQGPEQEVFQHLVSLFEEEQKNRHQRQVKIRVKQVPFSDLITHLRMACLSGHSPDVARVDIFQMVELAHHKVLYPLDELSVFDVRPEEFLSAPFATNLVEVRGEQHLYGLPEQATCLALFWNRALFRKYGPQLRRLGLAPQRAPRTWKEFLQYARILTDQRASPPRYGFAMRNSLWWTIPFFAGAGSPLFAKQNGQLVCLFGDEATTKALSLKVDLYRKYRVEAGAWKSGALPPEVGFSNGHYAMIFGGPWLVERFRRRGIDFGVALIPAMPKEWFSPKHLLPTSGTTLGGNNLVVLRKSKNPTMAYHFIRFVTSFPAQLLWCQRLGQIPTRRDVRQALLKREKLDPVQQAFLRQIEYALPPPPIPRYGHLESEIFNPELELALKGKKTPLQVLLTVRERVEREILRLLYGETQKTTH